jgi:hypothetical protein
VGDEAVLGVRVPSYYSSLMERRPLRLWHEGVPPPIGSTGLSVPESSFVSALPLSGVPLATGNLQLFGGSDSEGEFLAVELADEPNGTSKNDVPVFEVLGNGTATILNYAGLHSDAGTKTVFNLKSFVLLGHIGFKGNDNGRCAFLRGIGDEVGLEGRTGAGKLEVHGHETLEVAAKAYCDVFAQFLFYGRWMRLRTGDSWGFGSLDNTGSWSASAFWLMVFRLLSREGCDDQNSG